MSEYDIVLRLGQEATISSTW